ncbi:alpha/beta hydrolase [Marilutibacter aestuarii]|uniref:Alpha/beta hydrolase n=1 Tax=Marilutibacter aestuarii TaxID=1706195 RepID=A0A508AM18_9GAMM|nr:alpha/beta hydrolase [Lysobacter aestuarii]TQD50849.1 alpha/beta hydrolase [Lysobacter aestuarii]
MLLASQPALAETPSSETGADLDSRVFLWPGETGPGSAAVGIEQRIVERSDDPALPDRVVTGVTRPYLVVHRPVRANGRALLVIPGGAYRRIVLDKEGSALVPVFADALGYTLFVLRYRLPGEGHVGARDVSVADAQRAMRVIRGQADRWGIDPGRISAMGFSAGGHVAASLAMRHDETFNPPVDAFDRLDARPQGVLLLYPVIDMGAHAHAVSREHLLGPDPSPTDVAAYSMQNRVRAGMPPVFLLHAADDTSVAVANSLQLYTALREAGVPTEMHLYPRGGHGFGVRDIGGSSLSLWPRVADAWLRHLEAGETDEH